MNILVKEMLVEKIKHVVCEMYIRAVNEGMDNTKEHFDHLICLISEQNEVFLEKLLKEAEENMKISRQHGFDSNIEKNISNSLNDLGFFVSNKNEHWELY